jgi:RNA polymerase sigma factor (sigma-70 family)
LSSSDELERLVVETGAEIYSYLARRVGTPDDAEELLNDVFLVAWRRIDAMPRAAGEARLWLYGVAANLLRNQQRAVRRRSALARLLTNDPVARARDLPAEPDERVRDAIDALPSELAELVRLHHWEGFTLAEIGTVLDLPAPTVRTRYRAARRRLRAYLSPEDDENELSAAAESLTHR